MAGTTLGGYSNIDMQFESTKAHVEYHPEVIGLLSRGVLDG